MNGLLQTISQVGIFVICAQMILHLKPAESYGKYMRLLVSIMVLAQLLFPALNLVLRAEKGSFEDRITYYESIFSDNMEAVKMTCIDAENLLETLTMEEIKSRLNTEREGEKEALQNRKEDENREESQKEIRIERIEVLSDG